MASRGAGSQAKGKNFERAVAKLISDALNIQFRRTPSPERWKADKGDGAAPMWQKTIAHDFMWEMKNREAWAILDWYKKAKTDCGNSKQIPVVVATKNHEDSYAFLAFSDFLNILAELDAYRKASPQPKRDKTG